MGHDDVHGAAKHTDVERELFLPAFNDTNANAAMGFLGSLSVITLSDGVTGLVFFTFKVPDDFVSFTSLKAVWISPVASGNMSWTINAQYAGSGESHTTHTDYPAVGETATGGVNIINVQTPANALTLSELARGDYVGMCFMREGMNPNDTIEDIVHLLGLLFTYTAEQ